MILTIVLLFIIGAIIGSFLNVCIYRLPRHESIVSPGSHCPNCDSPVSWYDNVPLISYLLLGGRCRRCGEPISFWYPTVELLTAVLFALAGWKFGPTALLLPALLLIAALTVIFFIDLEHYIIPNVVVLPVAVIGLAAMIAIQPHRWLELLAAGLISGAFFFVIVLVFPKGMGLGDAKMAVMLGFFLGWSVVVALFAAFLLGALVGVTLIAVGTKGRKSRLPFGPFLAAGAVLALFYGQPLLDKYLSLLGA